MVLYLDLVQAYNTYCTVATGGLITHRSIHDRTIADPVGIANCGAADDGLRTR